MCGIVAMMSISESVNPARLERATNSLRHRGPDSMHTWYAEDGSAGLGHTRLSIIDLSTGDQPIANEDESVHIVVNGEFYDHERLRKELKQRGHKMRTFSDSELAVHYYEEQGIECLRYLRGEFAFVLWDTRKRTIFAPRDRFGIKPLYYMISNGVLMIASEAKAFAAAGATLSWNHSSFYQNILGCASNEHALFEGVKQVPPGHYLVANPGGVKVLRYWDLDYPRAQHKISLTEKEEKEWIERLRQGVDEAVRLRLRADVPVGCLLSGGLDSSSTLGIARKYISGPLAAFTVAFDHEDFDESELAKLTAERADATFHRVCLTDEDFAANFAKAVWHAEGLLYNAHGVARFLLSKAVKEASYKVMLAGEGADELGAGYHFCEQALTMKRKSGLFRYAGVLKRLIGRHSDVERRIHIVSPWLVRASRIIGFPDNMKHYLADKISLMHNLLAPDFIRSVQGQDPFLQLYHRIEPRKQLHGREPVKQLLALWMKSAFSTYVLAGERMDMAHGVELRLPFLDHHLFAIAREIPSSLFLRDGHQKWILREAMRPFVLERVRSGRKQPFMAPPSALRKDSPLYALAQDNLRGSALSRLPFFDRKTVIRLLDEIDTMPTKERSAFDPVLLMLLSACILQESYQL